jgi:hypothetical protein
MPKKNKTTNTYYETYSLPSGGLGLLLPLGGNMSTVSALGVSGFGHGEIEELTTNRVDNGTAVLGSGGRSLLVMAGNLRLVGRTDTTT